MRNPLGKGLQSLIPQKQSKISRSVKPLPQREDQIDSKKESIFNVEVDKIRPNSNQPRKDLSPESLKELTDSIREHGIIQPLVVTKVELATERGRKVEYELIAGERRWRAAKMAGLPHVPVIIRDTEADEKLELALVENIQREDLNPVETALAYKKLHDEFGLRHEEIAQKVGKKRTTVTNAMRILTLPVKVQQAIVSGQISEGHGRALLLAKPEARMPLFRSIIKGNLSVRQAEDRARKLAPPNKPGAKGPKNPFFKKLERDLELVLGHRVSITQRGELGHLRIEFSNRNELEKIVNFFLKT
jgi:ParB family chromosome partitioning protein